MKKYLLVFIALVILHISGYTQPLTHDIISTMRMGIFKLKTTKDDIEKLLDKKISFASKPDGYMDTVKVNFKNADYILTFTKRYNESEKAPVVYELFAVSSANTALKTKSMMGLQNTKADILFTYDKMDINIYNDWNYEEKGNIKDKIQYIRMNDIDAGTNLIFKTNNRITTEVEVRIYEGE